MGRVNNTLDKFGRQKFNHEVLTKDYFLRRVQLLHQEIRFILKELQEVHLQIRLNEGNLSAFREDVGNARDIHHDFVWGLEGRIGKLERAKPK